MNFITGTLKRLHLKHWKNKELTTFNCTNCTRKTTVVTENIPDTILEEKERMNCPFCNQEMSYPI